MTLSINVRETLVSLQKKTEEKRARSKEEIKEDETSLVEGEQALFEFMRAAREPITWIEARELWRGLRKTNNGEFPLLDETVNDLSESSIVFSQRLKSESDTEPFSDVEEAKDCEVQPIIAEEGGMVPGYDISQEDINSLSDEEVNEFATFLARGIKETYSIRASNDTSERNFILGSLTLLWAAVAAVAISGYFYPENATLGTLTYAILFESFVLFAIELVWECFLSWIVLRYNIKINYTRKFGNLLKVPKYFAADLFPAYTSTALSMTTALAINQTLFCLMYYRKSREKVPFFAYVFLSQDRREDRPDTLIFQVTEDIMRFAIYIPFKLLVVNMIGSKAIIFIPIAVNNIGDGLAEPVGVAWGKHKYTTTALYHKGRFFHSKFTRSYEGSACVYFITLIVVAANYNAFDTTQFWITLAILPFLMTIAEAKAPHTNDGPFLALVGCGFLSAIFLIGRDYN